MRRALAALAAALLGWLAEAGPASAQAPITAMPERPALFVTLTPEDAPRAGVRLQRQVVLSLRLVSARRFERLSVSLPASLEGAELIPLHRPRTREVRSYAADGFVHEAAVAIFPQRRGPLALPPIEAVGAVAGPDGAQIPFAERWPGARIEVSGIPEGWGDGWWMTADRVEIRERWSTPPDEVRREDVLRREVTVVAHGVPAERMAAPEFAPGRGVAVFEAGGSAATETGPGGVVGTLVRAWDIEIGDAEVLNLPPVRVAWWDAGADAPARAAVPALRLEPLAPDRAARAAALLAEAEAERRGARRLALALAALLAAPAAAALLAAAWRAGPDAADRRLRAACRAARGPRETRAAVEAWARARGGLPDPVRHRAAAAALARLDRALFGPPGGGAPPAPRALARALLAAARRERLAADLRRLRGAAAAAFGPARALPRAAPPEGGDGAG